jgi:hypothetical protein
MMKMISPIASPATVSVTQVLGCRQRQASAISAASRASGRQSNCALGMSAPRPPGTAGGAGRLGSGPALVPPRFVAFIGAPPATGPAAAAAGLVAGQLGHAAAVHHAAVVHHRHGVAQGLGHHEVLLHQQDGGLLALQFAKASMRLLDDRRRQALAGLVDQDQRTRLDDGAGHGQHLLLPAAELAGRVEPELLQRREQAEDPVQPLGVQLAGVARRGRPAPCSPSPTGR